MARYFTLEEAERLLGRVRPALRRIRTLREECAKTEAEIQAVSQRIMTLGGVRVDLGELAGLKHRRDSGNARLEEAVEHIHSCLLYTSDAADE